VLESAIYLMDARLVGAAIVEIRGFEQIGQKALKGIPALLARCTSLVEVI
jgi:hypothetical protein